jgi:hypothetical protein
VTADRPDVLVQGLKLAGCPAPFPEQDDTAASVRSVAHRELPGETVPAPKTLRGVLDIVVVPTTEPRQDVVRPVPFPQDEVLPIPQQPGWALPGSVDEAASRDEVPRVPVLRAGPLEALPLVEGLKLRAERRPRVDPILGPLAGSERLAWR